jgi:hypothetical protein
MALTEQQVSDGIKTLTRQAELLAKEIPTNTETFKLMTQALQFMRRAYGSVRRAST